MSHYTVLVIGNNIEKQLEPFWELDLCHEEMVEDNRAVFEVKVAAAETESHAREKAREWISSRHGKNIKYGKLKAAGKYEELVGKSLFVACNKPPQHYENMVNKSMEENRQDMRKYRRYLKELAWESVLKDYYGGGLAKCNGDWGYYGNPSAKWDWYEIGGRWAGYFTLKHGKGGVLGKRSWALEDQEIAINEADQAFKGDIDWEAMKAKNEAGARKCWAEYQREVADGKNPHAYVEYSIEEADTEETYVARQALIATFAVIKDGKWYERGCMGWWGTVSDEKERDVWNTEFEKLVMGLPDDTLLTVVDCHI